MDTKGIYPNMNGLGICKPKELCGYHVKKVEKSIFPPPSVLGLEHQRVILQDVNKFLDETPSGGNIINRLKGALEVTSNYWNQHKDVLNTSLYNAWDDWQIEAEKDGKYPAGGWASSPEQLSQFLTILTVLGREKEGLDKILRLGTASGIHTKQEFFTLALALAGSGAKLEEKLEFNVIDQCLPPLTETENTLRHLTRRGIISTREGSVLELPDNHTYNLITGHFIEYFMPTKDAFTAANMAREAALEMKQSLFRSAYNALSSGGVFCTALGSSDDEWRFHTTDEMRTALKNAGFDEENIVIIPTTDPLDYDHKNEQHIQNINFIVAAVKN